MEPECWICKQKAEYKQQLLNAAITLAKNAANKSGETMAIVKTSGCIYVVFTATEAQQSEFNVLQYISSD